MGQYRVDILNSRDGNDLVGTTPLMLLESYKLLGMLQFLGLESNFLSSFNSDIADFCKLWWS